MPRSKGRPRAGSIWPCEDILWSGTQKSVMNIRRQTNGMEQSNVRNLEKKINIRHFSQVGDIEKIFACVLCPLNAGRIGIWKCWILRRGENQSTILMTFLTTHPLYNFSSACGISILERIKHYHSKSFTWCNNFNVHLTASNRVNTSHFSTIQTQTVFCTFHFNRRCCLLNNLTLG